MIERSNRNVIRGSKEHWAFETLKGQIFRLDTSLKTILYEIHKAFLKVIKEAVKRIANYTREMIS